MKRRHYLGFASLLMAVPMSGCAANTNNGASTPTATPVPAVSVVGKSFIPPAPVSILTIRFGTATTAVLRPPDSVEREPDPGFKYVIIHAEIEVESELESSIDVYGSVLGLQAGGVVYDPIPIRNLPEITQTVLPGATYEAWASVEVPEEATEATLLTTDALAWFEHQTKIVIEAVDTISATISDG